jgi:hypothetical protein
LLQRLWCRTCNVSVYLDQKNSVVSFDASPDIVVCSAAKTAIIFPAVSPAQWEVRCCTGPLDDLLPTETLGLLIAFSQRIGFFDWFDQHFPRLHQICRLFPHTETANPNLLSGGGL